MGEASHYTSTEATWASQIIKALKKHYCVSTEDISELIGIDNGTVKLWEKGLSGLALRTLKRIQENLKS
jgi:DNA-binding transcriptional regulator YiaG